jgi:UPF0176 protein
MKRLYNRINRDILKKRVEESPVDRKTLSFYRYALIESPDQFRDTLYDQLDQFGVLGRIYVANEGINGQISIPEDQLESFRQFLDSMPMFGGLRLNFAIEDDPTSFFKLTIKVRHKIVADGLNDSSFDVTNKGVHLDAARFNQLTNKEETIVVDMRNHYESEVGHFENAICPDVETFREALPKVVDMLRDQKDKPIVMYCTGGIRCEKASAFLKHQGFKDVYQLDGGIIEYARQVETQGLPNKFKGKNFVFDERLGERISNEIISQCHQCGVPCDTHANCANEACHILFIQCPECAVQLDGCCSTKCADFMQLPVEEQKEKRKTEVFNGTKFGKGRYKANNQKKPMISPT